jgi:hypothetical protein
MSDKALQLIQYLPHAVYHYRRMKHTRSCWRFVIGSRQHRFVEANCRSKPITCGYRFTQLERRPQALCWEPGSLHLMLLSVAFGVRDLDLPMKHNASTPLHLVLRTWTASVD